MSIVDILRTTARPRHLACTLAVVAVAAACSPRQARVESEPNPGAAAATPSAGEEALRVDLRRLADAQERYVADNGYYASRPGDLGFTSSANIRVSIIQGDRNGWSAVAGSGDDECGIFHGEVRSPRGYLTQPGQVACR